MTDRKKRKSILENKERKALCTQKKSQLWNETVEEREFVDLRRPEVAVEKGPIPLAAVEVFIVPELIAEMDEIVTNALKNGPDEHILVEAFSLRITRRDLRTLERTNWLNDEIINFYMNLLIERGKLDNYPSVYCYNTFFYPKLATQGYSSIKRWTKNMNIFVHDLLIVPVHQNVHWCLACINLHEKEIMFYDSMGGKNNTCLQILMEYLEAESMDEKKVKFDNRGWCLKNMRDNPQQNNDSDCGMFTCMYAEYLCRKAKINFQQSDIPFLRRKMAYEILTKRLLM